jgi:hypothetical protein
MTKSLRKLTQTFSGKIAWFLFFPKRGPNFGTGDIFGLRSHLFCSSVSLLLILTPVSQLLLPTIARIENLSRQSDSLALKFSLNWRLIKLKLSLLFFKQEKYLEIAAQIQSTLNQSTVLQHLRYCILCTTQESFDN